MNQYIAKPGSS